MKRLRFDIVVIGALWLMFSCTGDGYTPELRCIDTLIDSHADSALALLDAMKPDVPHWPKSCRMRHALLTAKAQNKADVVFTSDSVAKDLVNYFDDNGSRNERVEAHYLLGRALSDMGEAPKALQAYYDAIECADTTSSSCNYNTLKGVYGQMAQIFHKQDLPHDEIWALQHYIGCIQRTKGIEDYIVARYQLIRPYYLLDEKDTVLQLINSTYQSLKKLGNTKRAAGIISPAIYIYTERKQLDKARQLINIFESESELFDEKGNIAHGREHYYNTKGFYELAINQVDSAEFYFRKAICHGEESDAYKGLLEVYRQKGDLDSIVHFSKLNEAALDTLHNQMQTDAIHQMSQLYNYNRSQKIAEQERTKARETRMMVWLVTILALLAIVVFIIVYFRLKQKKEKEIKELNTSLNSAKVQRSEVQEELKQLKAKHYDALIAEKDRKEQELTHTIEDLQEKLGLSENADSLKNFSNSQIAKIFIKKAGSKTERPIPTEAEWKLLVAQFCKDLPSIYKSFGGTKTLSPLELRTCILVLLDFQEKTIAMMTKSSSQTVSQAKARANEKLYGKKDAPSLRNNLLSTYKRI